MRQIGTLPDEQLARRFQDYLLARGMKSMVESDDESWLVWIHDEDHVEPAREELAQFTANPEDATYTTAAEAAKHLRKTEEKRNEQARKRNVDVRQQWQRPVAQRCPATMTLVIVAILVSLISSFGSTVEPMISLLGFAKFVGKAGKPGWYLPITASGFEQIASGQIWRLVTPIFIHLSPFHLLGNAYWTYIFGTMFESLRGTRRMLIFVAAAAVLSNVIQCAVSGPSFGGLSGVGYGLFGFLWIKGRFDPWSGFRLHPTTVFMFVAWFFLCMTPVVGHVANTAHAVGFLVGAVWAYAPIALGRKG